MSTMIEAREGPLAITEERGDGRVYVLTGENTAAAAAAAAAAAQSATDATTNGAAQVALAEAAAADAALAALGAQGALIWDSLRFPPENGEDPVDLVTSLNGENGLLELANTNNLFFTSVAYDTRWLDTAGCVLAMVDIEPLIYDGLNRTPYIFGTITETTGSRALGLRYTPRANGVNTSAINRFTFFGRGESGASAEFNVDSVEVPDGLARMLVALRFDGTAAQLDLIDPETGTIYAGTPVTKPSGWVGIGRLTNNLVIGAHAGTLWPKLASANNLQSITGFRGQVGFVTLADKTLTDGELQAIAAGANPATTIGSSDLRLHCPLTQGGGLHLGVTSNMAALANGLTQRGTLYPGSTLRPQGATNFLFMDRLTDPCILSTKRGETTARLPRTYRFGGVSGPIEMRVQDAGGEVFRDWHAIGTLPTSGSTGGLVVHLPQHLDGSVWRLSFRAKAGSEWIYHRDNADVAVAYTGLHIGQSEMVRALDFSVTTTGQLSALALGETYERTERFVFRTSWNDDLGRPVIYRGTFSRGHAGAGQIRMTNELRKLTNQPLCFVNASVPGTQIWAWLDDDDTTRKWSDFELALQGISSRDAQGRPIVTGATIMWEAFFSGTNWAPQVLRPLALGLQSATTAEGHILQADIDHFLFDGVTLNPDFSLVICPANRGVGHGASATVDDSLPMGLRRMSMRDDSTAVAQVLIGPESGVHALEASGPDASTHPDPERETGMGPWCRSIAGGHALSFGLIDYQPVSFTYRFGASNAEIIATVAGTRLGVLDTEGNWNAVSYGDTRADPVGLAVQGWEVNDGGTFTRDGFTGEIINAREIRLAKSSGTWGAGTTVRFHPGGPGSYTGLSGTGATTAENAWVKQSPVFAGFEVAGTNTGLEVA